MRKLIVAVIAAMLLIATSPLWAEGGKKRHGQDDSQPRSQFRRAVDFSLGPGSGVTTPDSTGTQLRKRDRDRDRDGCGDQAGKQLRKRDRDRDRDGSCDQVGKQQRKQGGDRDQDRDRDGSCQAG